MPNTENAALLTSVPLVGHSSTTRVQRLPRLIIVAWLVLGLGLVMISWVFVAPLMSAADEPNQAINAAAVVRGQFDEPLIKTHAGQTSLVRVPADIGGASSQPDCFAFKRRVAANCAPSLPTSTRDVKEKTQFSNYPPLFFVLTGLPTLVLHGRGTFYAMRLMAVAVNGALLLLGLLLLIRYHPRRLLLVGALVALSPMVLYFGSMVNNSGMETAAGFATWCGALCLIEQDRIPPPLAMWTALAAAVFALSRPLSPLYLAILIVVVAVVAGKDRIRKLFRQRFMRLMCTLVGVVVLVAIAFSAMDGTPSLLGGHLHIPLSLWGEIERTIRLTGTRLMQAVGNFGWLDTQAPVGTIVVWAIGGGWLLVWGMRTSPRCRRALPLLLVAIFLLPVVFESPRIDAVGSYWQGRYWLPLLVGVPLIASAAVSRQTRGAHARNDTPPTQPLAAAMTLIPLLVIAQVAAFLTVLHRYQIGLGLPPGSPVRWTPPGGSFFLIFLFVAGTLLLAGYVAWALFTDPQSTSHLREDFATVGVDGLAGHGR